MKIQSNFLTQLFKLFRKKQTMANIKIPKKKKKKGKVKEEIVI